MVFSKQSCSSTENDEVLDTGLPMFEIWIRVPSNFHIVKFLGFFSTNNVCMVFWNHLYPLPVTMWLSFPMINVLERWHLRWVCPMFYLEERPHNRQWVWGCTKVMDKSLYLETYSSIWLSFMLSHSLVTGKTYEHHLVFFLRGHAMRSKPTLAVDGLPWGTQAYFHCILENQNQPMATAGMGFRGEDP